MANSPEHDTLICLFHHTDRAERTVQELLEMGIPESAITLIGHARETADINTGTATLDTIHVPDADRKRLMDGLRAGGSIVAVSADSSMAGKIEDIFKEYSADKIDEKVLATSDPEVLGRGTSVDASVYPTTITETSVDLPPVGRVVTMNPPVVETAYTEDPVVSSTLLPDVYGEDAIDEVILVSKPVAASAGSPNLVTTEETLILLEPTDLVEDTDLVEPRTQNSATSASSDRFDPNAPVDDVRNPMSDRLNDPLNRR